MRIHRLLLGGVLPLALLTTACTTIGVGPATGPDHTHTSIASPSRATPQAAAGGGAQALSPAAPAPTRPGVAPSGPPTAAPRPGSVSGAADSSGDQQSVLDSVPGPTQPGCAVVGTQGDVRSGSLVVGNFADARGAVKRGGVNGADVSFYVIPASAKAMPGVELKATSPTGAVRTVRSHELGEADPWSYYRVSLPVRDPGVWRLDFSAGQNHGCFSVRF